MWKHASKPGKLKKRFLQKIKTDKLFFMLSNTYRSYYKYTRNFTIKI